MALDSKVEAEDLIAAIGVAKDGELDLHRAYFSGHLWRLAETFASSRDDDIDMELLRHALIEDLKDATEDR
jgi:hypothetical protein